MFGFNKPRFENLDKYLAAKDYDKALTAVVAELKRNPSQFNLLLRQAEILGLAGNRDKAITLYKELAEKYAKDGFFAKAIALYKKVLRLDPELEEIHSELARLIDEEAKGSLPLEERLAMGQAKKHAENLQKGTPTPEDKERQSSALFSAFPKEALEDLLASTNLRSYQEGDIIVTEGEEGHSLFLLVSGEVKVFTRGERGEHLQLAELGEGDFFGEVSLLTGKPRTATITAKSVVNAIELTKSAVDGIAAEHPGVRAVLEDFYETRAQATVEAVIQKMRDD
jgi:cAMP-dependent protein kinase regulator